MSGIGSTVIPSLRYKDAHAAIDWLVRVFGFTAQAVYEGPDNTVMHAQLTHGQGMLMLGSAQNGGEFAEHMASLDETGGRMTTGLCLIVQDCDAVYAKAQEAGAEIVQELNEPEYGGKAFACKDPEGYVWWIGSYNPWTSPAPEAS
ncbi:MAG TPA: VOC family protein [Acidobacteriaceae bacterium]|jgi:uncharacterized glyoxalase superfamily protein PhnB